MEIQEGDKISVPNATDYCRTCMERKSSSDSFTNIFNVPLLAEMLTTCASVQVLFNNFSTINKILFHFEL